MIKLEFGHKDLKRRTFWMENSIDDHWSVAIKREKLKDILLEKPAKIPIKMCILRKLDHVLS